MEEGIWQDGTLEKSRGTVPGAVLQLPVERGAAGQADLSLLEERLAGWPLRALGGGAT